MFFEDFFSGGMPGGGQSMRREEVNTDELYETLGVEKNATQREIKKAWRKLARQHHPDRGGDPETYKNCEEAHSVLQDADKRALYDEGGIEAVRSGHAGPTNIFDLFGGGMRQQRERGPKKPQPIKQLLEISLEDVVSGSTKKFVTVTVMSADEKVECKQCNGRGAYMERIHRGHMVLQTQKTCPRCDGKGISFKNEKKIDKKLEVYIPPGVCDGDKFPMEGEGHDLPDMPTGDVIIIFKIKPHPVFKRMGADLAMVKELTLVQALCGYDFHVKSIVTGEWLRVQSESGSVIQHGDVIRVDEQGLPQKGSRHGIKGNLYIRFHVVLPETGSLNTEDIQNLGSLLSKEACTYAMGNTTKNSKQEICVGSRVRLIGLQNRPDLNGVEGSVIQENIRPGQYAVQLVTDQIVAVRDELIELLDVVEEDEVVETPKEDDYIETVGGEKVEDMERVRHTAAEFGNIHDEDEMDEEGVGCRQM